MKRIALLFATLTATILVLLIVQISISNMLSIGGIKLSQMQDQIQNLQRQNTILKEKVLSISSLTYVAQKAETQGFAPDKTEAVVVSHVAPPLALNQ